MVQWPLQRRIDLGPDIFARGGNGRRRRQQQASSKATVRPSPTTKARAAGCVLGCRSLPFLLSLLPAPQPALLLIGGWALNSLCLLICITPHWDLPLVKASCGPSCLRQAKLLKSNEKPRMWESRRPRQIGTSGRRVGHSVAQRVPSGIGAIACQALPSCASNPHEGPRWWRLPPVQPPL